MKEIPTKFERVRRFLKTRRAAAVLFTSRAGFSWITAGGNGHVAIAGESSCAGVLITRHKAFLLTNNIEARRLLSEELLSRQFESLIFPWHHPAQAVSLLAKIVGRGKVLSDQGTPNTIPCAPDLARLRWRLVPEEIHRYRALGELTARALESTARKIKPGITELDIAAMLSSIILRHDALPHLILVGVDERIEKYRHPLPTSKKLRRSAMLIANVKRHGLIASATRTVHFGQLSRNLRKRHEASCYVDIVLNMATRPDAIASDIFKAGMAAYARMGFPHEWKLHHQGGAIGYEGRDWKATPDCKEMVLENQAFAWNPSVTGAKSEDTTLTTATGLEVLTLAGPRWPMIHFHHPDGCVERPAILER